MTVLSSQTVLKLSLYVCVTSLRRTSELQRQQRYTSWRPQGLWLVSLGCLLFSESRRDCWRWRQHEAGGEKKKIFSFSVTHLVKDISAENLLLTPTAALYFCTKRRNDDDWPEESRVHRRSRHKANQRQLIWWRTLKAQYGLLMHDTPV